MIVTVNVPDPPCVIDIVSGTTLVTVGGAGVTCAVLVMLPPFNETVIRVLPGLTAVTGIDTLVWPVVNATDAGAVATAVAELLTARLPAAVGAGDSVAVNVPVAPTVIGNGSGTNAVGTGFGAPSVALNLAARLVASKYSRKPTALLCPAHLVPSGLVPIRVRTFSDNPSVLPLKVCEVNEPKDTAVSKALFALRVIPVTHSVWPAANTVPFLLNSARTSKLVPWSSLFFSPNHTCRGASVLSVPELGTGFAGHVPTVCQGLPPLKFTLPESLYFSVVAVGAVVFRKSVAGFALAPVPCREKSVADCP